MAIVYVHKKKNTNDVFYVGIGRKESRAYCKHKRTNLWRKIVAKYGYDVQITHYDVCWEEASCIEKYLISLYGRIDNNTGILANMTDGGDGTIGKRHTSETKIKISNKAKDRLSKKEFHPMFGRKQSEQSIQKNRLSQLGEKGFYYGVKGKNHPKYGLKPTERHIEILKQRMKGVNNPNYGNKGAKCKVSKKITSFKDGIYKNYGSIIEASKELNISETSISKCCKKLKYSTKGFRFKYQDDDYFIGEYVKIKRKHSEETKIKIASSLIGKKRGKYASSHKSNP